jgi:tRNA A37 threonylcarbamoyladenosine modification protein TsaB
MASDLHPLPLPALVIDGSSASTFVGILGVDLHWLGYTCSGKPPLESLFTTVESVSKEADLPLGNLRAYLYTEGPGSVLGLRLCAMAIETWSRLFPHSANYFAYNSLTLVAAQVLSQSPETRDALILSDWKKDLWNAVAIKSGQIQDPAPVTPETLVSSQSPLYHLPARKGWQSPPREAQRIEARPDRLPQLLNTPDLLKRTQGVQLYSAGSNTFQKWTARRHPPSAYNTTA